MRSLGRVRVSLNNIRQILRCVSRALKPKPSASALRDRMHGHRRTTARDAVEPVQFIVKWSTCIVIWKSSQMKADRVIRFVGMVLREVEALSAFCNASVARHGMVERPNDQRSHAGPRTLKCNRDGIPALADAVGSVKDRLAWWLQCNSRLNNQTQRKPSAAPGTASRKPL